VTERSDAPIAALALSASGLVIAAPVFGRTGHAHAAAVAVALAAGCGFGSFLLAGFATLRAARARSHPGCDAEDAS
jgi:hypothetical protein